MREYKTLRVIALSFALILIGCSSKNDPDMPQIPAFQTQTTDGSYQVNKIRLSVLKDTARSVGAQASLYWSAQQYNASMESQNKNLERIFNFQAMMLNNNVIPPVLEESSNILNLDNSASIRIADQEYRIVTPAHFVTTVPSWRDYLMMNFTKPEPPDSSLLPKNNDERDIWNRYVLTGWNEGITQAKEIFQLNLDHLQRDYKGMILYRKLLAQDMVTPPFVSKADLGVTGDANNMRVNDRILRITAVSQLKTNSKVWTTRIYKPTKGLTIKPKPQNKPISPISQVPVNYHAKTTNQTVTQITKVTPATNKKSIKSASTNNISSNHDISEQPL